MKNTFDDEEALMAAVGDDPTCFGIIFDRHYEQILRYCVRRTGDVVVAEDITSEVFMKALRSVGRYEWRGVSVQAWLYKIATNEIRMYYRSNKRVVKSLEDLQEKFDFEPVGNQDIEQEAIEAQEQIERNDQFMRAQQLIQKLPIKYQEVLVLRFVERKKVHEIAEITGRKDGTIKSLLSRGLAKLRSEMQPNQVNSIIDVEGTILYKKSPGRNV